MTLASTSRTDDLSRGGPGQRAASHHLPGFGVAVDDMLAQIQPHTVSDEA